MAGDSLITENFDASVQTVCRVYCAKRLLVTRWLLEIGNWGRARFIELMPSNNIDKYVLSSLNLRDFCEHILFANAMEYQDLPCLVSTDLCPN